MEPANHACFYNQSVYGSSSSGEYPSVPYIQQYPQISPPTQLYQVVEKPAPLTQTHRGQPANRKKSRTVSQVEKDRHLAHNTAYANLRRRIPDCPGGLAKYKTLKLATEYIKFLNDQLQSPNPARVDDFKYIVAKEVRVKNNYKDKADRLLNNEALLAETYTHKASMPPLPTSSAPPLPDSTTGSPPQLAYSQINQSLNQNTVFDPQHYYYHNNVQYI